MAIELAKECDVGQGYSFKQDEHHRYGYITQLVLGDVTIAPDIRVIQPGDGPMSTAPVVAVLSDAKWSTLANENIALQGRVSVANAQLLNLLAMQALKKVRTRIAFVIHEYDLTDQTYFPCFKTYKGEAPKGSKPAAGGGPTDVPVYGVAARVGGLESSIKVGNRPEEDPLGIVNHVLELSLSPASASKPQQLLIQTSATVKLIQPWGLPQA